MQFRLRPALTCRRAGYGFHRLPVIEDLKYWRQPIPDESGKQGFERVGIH